jgi:hypothetical protein
MRNTRVLVFLLIFGLLEPDFLLRVPITNFLLGVISDTSVSRTKSQKAQWERLDILNKKRANLESLIISSMKSIEAHSANISNAMTAMFGGRMEDIQEGSASSELS